jgi:hypothetical protein
MLPSGVLVPDKSLWTLLSILDPRRLIAQYNTAMATSDLASLLPEAQNPEHGFKQKMPAGFKKYGV